MARASSFWLVWGPLCWLMFCASARDSSWECLEKDEVVTEMSKDVELPSECVMSCTALSYMQIALKQQRVTVRFKDSQPGDSGEFCWFIHTKCWRWDEVFVLASVNESVFDGETVQLETSSAVQTSPVLAHNATSILPDACGLRFDVSPHFRSQPSLCVRLKGIVGSRLKCPPFLVTIQKQKERERK